MDTDEIHNAKSDAQSRAQNAVKESKTVRRKFAEFWEEWRALFFFLFIMVLFRSAIADWNQVPTGSMKPTILEGDRVVVNKLAYDLKFPFTTWHLAQWDEPKRGEIVTFHSPVDEKLLIKRVIGIPGDIIGMRQNQLYINNKPASYSHLDMEIVNQLDYEQRRTHSFLSEKYNEHEHAVMLSRKADPNAINSFPPIEIPPGHYWMLGDNRDNSRDSRFIGWVARDRIMGRAHTVAFSVKEYYVPRIDRFLRPLE